MADDGNYFSSWTFACVHSACKDKQRRLRGWYYMKEVSRHRHDKNIPVHPCNAPLEISLVIGEICELKLQEELLF